MYKLSILLEKHNTKSTIMPVVGYMHNYGMTEAKPHKYFENNSDIFF